MLVWDVDKTYLDTPLSSIKVFTRVPVEFSVDKHPIEGMPEVLRGLRWGPSPAYQGIPLVFVSASPTWMRGILERRMTMDGVEYDIIVLKDWVWTIKRLGMKGLKEQIGFKLCALLDLRSLIPKADFYLFGDDWESDPVAYALFQRMINEGLKGMRLEEELQSLGVPALYRDCIHESMLCLPWRDTRVRGIYIHLEKGLDPDSLPKGVIGVKGALQLALVLHEKGILRAEYVDLVTRSIRSPLKLLIDDAVHRGLVPGSIIRNLIG